MEKLIKAIRECLPDLERFVSTQGPGPDKRLADLKAALEPQAPVYVCGVCGGSNLQIKAWVDPNTGDYIDDYSEGNDCEHQWCSDCDSHAAFKRTEDTR